MTPKDFHRTYIAAARANERASGVPALFTLAQSALETGWGRHAPGNMLFGIKAGAGWTGRRQLCVTREVFADARQGHRFAEVLAIAPRTDGKFDYTVRDWFRAYGTPLESFADHARLLRGNARYAGCFATRDPREFARRIAAAGYATDPGYATSLIATIATLKPFDKGTGSTAEIPKAGSPAESGSGLPRTPGPSEAGNPRGGLFGAILSLFLGLMGGRKP